MGTVQRGQFAHQIAGSYQKNFSEPAKMNATLKTPVLSMTRNQFCWAYLLRDRSPYSKEPLCLSDY